MQLTRHSDYALRLLMRLALAPDEVVTIQEIAEAYGISRNHLMKIALELGRHGFIETLRGRGGGLRLGKAPSEIRLGAVVRATEDSFALVECFDADHNRCVITGACRLRGALREALQAFLAVLDGYTLADLVARPAALRRQLDLAPAAAQNP
ncbi:transcriptional regulator, BadM/Rrf2 family [Tistlia consotensis]|uniref:Transcriptional regulator, BadM/Rrf2 family n=1 Tax=Tistlia consotensis USBA 355 TaxID=560819 RepID=A0A1Y6CTJ5_9PROT|nr:Rrf2 family transcriptional regulator [Tistlia consotensis]SMF76051.1 transcriptional regulator, BadM/Rrf2 family [Tistlia consotensis USBA 355]SNS12061.1 transcriptional regulator, BadM/Rrf2 family [Tistlia consotensis]